MAHHFSYQILLALTIGLIQKSECILRNPVTDRCIHLGYNQAIRNDQLSVFVDECSWIVPEKGIQGNRDQWVEIIPFKPEEQQHKIQKWSTESLLCIRTEEDSISVGDCRPPGSIFLFKPVQNNYSGPEELFVIEEPSSGKCLTVEPGSQNLTLQNCSENIPGQRSNPFQSWMACRHVKACDVEISWTPSRIIFPKDPFNLTSDFQTEVKPDEVKGQEIDLSSAKIIINEPIYFIQNKLEKITEKEIIKTISDFYTKEELQEALDILNTNRFSLEIDPRLGLNMEKISLQLVTRVKQIVHTGASSKVVFVSRNISRVPVLEGNSKYPNVEKIRKHFEIIDQNLRDLKDSFLQSDLKIKQSPVIILEPLKTESSSEIGGGSDVDIENIDIRFGPPRNNLRNKESKPAKIDENSKFSM